MLDYIFAHPNEILELTRQHLQITAVAVILSILIGVPLGILVARTRSLQPAILGTASLLYTIPSLALFAFLIPFLGLGDKSTILALILYSQLTIIRNTVVGIQGVSPGIIESATGMGMTRAQILTKVQLPLAVPLIMAGVRTVTVMDIGIATIAAFIGAGGLGVLIYNGIARLYPEMIVAGALPVAVLALLADFILHRVEDFLRPRGLKAVR